MTFELGLYSFGNTPSPPTATTAQPRAAERHWEELVGVFSSTLT